MDASASAVIEMSPSEAEAYLAEQERIIDRLKAQLARESHNVSTGYARRRQPERREWTPKTPVPAIDIPPPNHDQF